MKKNNKIKESLLDTKEYVVLDIKLKKGINTSFFGKARFTSGYQEKPKLGGYSNLFSINKKTNFHLFSEYDAFGNQTISLDAIRNIGREAFAKIFELPADFETLTRRSAYQSELYGFNDYTLANRGIVGLTSKFEPSEKWTIFFGSYNSSNKTNQGQNVEQSFQTISQNLEYLRSIATNSSKNKLEIRFDASKTKLRFDSNLVYDKPDENTINRSIESDKTYDFNGKKENFNFYNNIFFEQKISSNLGLEVKASNAAINSKVISLLQHNDPNYFLGNSSIRQDIRLKTNQNNAQITLQYLSLIGVLRFGNFYENRKLAYTSTSKIASLSQEKTNYSFQRIKPFIHYLFDIGSFSFSTKTGLSFFEYTTLKRKKEKKKIVDFNMTVDFGIPDIMDNIMVSYSNRFSAYPLTKLITANTLIDFQTIEIPAESIAPQKESVTNFSLSRKLDALDIDLEISGLMGNINNENEFVNSNSTFLQSRRNQLKSNYQVFAIYLQKSFDKIPISLKLSPEALFNTSENKLKQKSYYLKTRRYFLGLKASTNFKNKWYDFDIYPKFSRFHFENTLSNSTSNQDMFSFSFNTSFKLMKDNLFIDMGIRRVEFFKGNSGHFNNINVEFSGNVKRFRWFVNISNITNDRQFIQRNIFPNYFVSQSNQVFGRFIKFGIEYKFLNSNKRK